MKAIYWSDYARARIPAAPAAGELEGIRARSPSLLGSR